MKTRILLIVLCSAFFAACEKIADKSFTEPYVEWGASESNVVALYGEPDNISTAEGFRILLYSAVDSPESSELARPLTSYWFKDGGLRASIVLITDANSKEIDKFLRKRYTEYYVTNDEYDGVYGNSSNRDNATTIILYYWSKENSGYLVSYEDANYVTFSSTSSRSIQIREALKDIYIK